MWSNLRETRQAPERRFAFRLALMLGMTVSELGARMSSSEFAEWMAYDRLEPFGELRADYRNGLLLATVLGMAGKEGIPGNSCCSPNRQGNERASIEPSQRLRRCSPCCNSRGETVTTVASLLVKIDGSATGYTKTLDAVEQRARQFGRGMTEAGKIATVGLTVPIVAGATLAANAYNQLNRELANTQSWASRRRSWKAIAAPCKR